MPMTIMTHIVYLHYKYGKKHSLSAINQNENDNASHTKLNEVIL